MTILQYVHLLQLQDNKTPLHYAVESGGNSYTVQVLLSEGASIDCVDKVSDYITIITHIEITGEQNSTSLC